jgi:2-succinyl-5-enolpyruvyl-6-hydroxy-3-cyclohexene-1-carboxylate synthase
VSDADTQATFAATLVDEWVRAGVTDVVVAPGSRSTPLTVALADDGRMRLHIVLDERSAGFVALGLGLATSRPAVVVTTSGTAAVELHPAVVEADHAGVPLLAVTADRPFELHAVRAPQTIEQAGLFGGSVRWAASPGVASVAESGSWRSLAARAFWETLGSRGGWAPGPVHLNLAFREPLLGTVSPLPTGRPGGTPWHQVTSGVRTEAPAAVISRLASLAGGRGLIVAGGGVGAGSTEAVHGLADAFGWPVLADARSGCRVAARATVGAADALLRTKEVADSVPEVVLRLGEPWVSRVVATWLAGLGPEVEQVLVDPFGRWADPERTAGLVVRADPDSLCVALTDERSHWGAWGERWAALEAAAQAAFDDVLARHPEVTEPGVARTVAATVPTGGVLFTSSSMPMRDVEWYARPRDGVRVLANRGANGIDGVVSSALGVALGGDPVIALVGDLAFLYDTGGLVGAAERGSSCTLVVVDNDGGGIFSFLPQASALAPERFERLWGTPHGLDLGAVARGYGVPVVVAHAADEVKPAVLAAVREGGVGIVLVRTSRRANVAVHEELHEAVAAAVRGITA